MEAMNEYNPEDPKIITYFNEIVNVPVFRILRLPILRIWVIKKKCVNGFFANVRLNWHLKATVSGRLRAGYFNEKEENRKIYRMNVLADDREQGFAF